MSYVVSPPDKQLEALWNRLSTGFVPRVAFFLMQLTVGENKNELDQLFKVSLGLHADA